MADMIKLKFPDGAVKEFPQGTTTEEVAASISPGLRKSALAGKVDDKLIDLKSPITEDGEIAIITPQSSEALRNFTPQYGASLGTSCQTEIPGCETWNRSCN